MNINTGAKGGFARTSGYTLDPPLFYIVRINVIPSILTLRIAQRSNTNPGGKIRVNQPVFVKIGAFTHA